MKGQLAKMIDIMYKFQNLIVKLLKHLRIYSTPKLRGFIHVLFSTFTCFLYKIISNFENANKRTELTEKVKKRDKKIIVSLTSFPGRIETVWLTINTLINQTLKPDCIILWLAESEFENGIKSLPEKLVDLQRCGLSIRFCNDNIKPHKKYYYTMKEFPNDIIITVDDDVLYPSQVIEDLVDLNMKYQKCICCTRGHNITINPDLSIKPYSQWIINPPSEEVPSKYICPTGVGGVLYPPGSFNSEVLNIQKIKSLCINADDLWLKIMSLLNNTLVVKSKKYEFDFFTVSGTQNNSLSKINVKLKENDIQLASILSEFEVRFNVNSEE